ncbi:CheR family methyltransferase [Nitrospirota bacterium]
MRDLISDYCGIFFDDESRYIFERRLTRRLEVIGLDNFRDYYRFLLYNKGKSEELDEIIDILTVNETYFFREQRQFQALIEEIAPELMRAKSESKRLRIWSAGCASGEEPYTIAMLILENESLFRGWDIEVLGSDINQRVLQKARRGVYRKNSFRTTDQFYLRKYFEGDDSGYRIKDNVRKLVQFSCLNLLDTNKMKFVDGMDVIFCRNVLIYFHTEAKKKAVESFNETLMDGGYLLLGHAESLMNISTSFSLKHLKNDMVYQKPKKAEVSMTDESLFRMVWGQ